MGGAVHDYGGATCIMLDQGEEAKKQRKDGKAERVGAKWERHRATKPQPVGTGTGHWAQSGRGAPGLGTAVPAGGRDWAGTGGCSPGQRPGLGWDWGLGAQPLAWT